MEKVTLHVERPELREQRDVGRGRSFQGVTCKVENLQMPQHADRAGQPAP